MKIDFKHQLWKQVDTKNLIKPILNTPIYKKPIQPKMHKTAMSSWYNTNTITSSTSTSGVYITHNGGTGSTANVVWGDDALWVDPSAYKKLVAGQSYDLPDGAKIEIDNQGNYKVIDKDAHVIYQACRIRAFNRFLNASELLEKFFSALVPFGVTQKQALQMPIESFINWLIYEAAKADGDALPVQRHTHRCIQCRRFIPVRLVAQGINVCSPLHLERYMNRTALPKPEAVIVPLGPE